MGWLRFGLELEDELEVEKAVRCIRSNDDLEKLRNLAEECYRAWVTQADITSQLMQQVADLESRVIMFEPVEQKYLDWAEELLGPSEQPSAARPRGPLSWFRRS